MYKGPYKILALGLKQSWAWPCVWYCRITYYALASVYVL